MFESYPDVLTVEQLSSALQIGMSKAYELCHSGEIQFIAIGRKILIPKICLLQYLLNCDIILPVTADRLAAFSERSMYYDR